MMRSVPAECSVASRAARGAVCGLACGVLLAGCTSGNRADADARRLELRDFSTPSAELPQDAIRMSPDVLAGPTVEVAVVEESVDVNGRRLDVAEARGEVTSRSADGRREVDAVTPRAIAVEVREGQTWPVEGLVGQVNGRPIFADSFFEPIEDRILQICAQQDRVEARRALVEFVRRMFKEAVDSELVVAEAESKLSPEQQQGLFAWLRSMQEETIAELGGSRAAAEASLEEERSLTLDEFMRERRDIALARKLLNERIEPRTIVSWRDVQQEYELRKAEFNPPPTLRVGRIRLAAQADAQSIELVKARVAEGKTFSQIAAELKLPEGGLWNSFDLPADGIAGLPFSDAIKSRLAALEVDRVSTPMEQRDFITWYAVLAIDRAPARSIYDRSVQLQLENEIKGRREIIERERYIATLRSRWVTDDIGAMERKLLEICLERYWR
jgi:hypothetical protein